MSDNVTEGPLQRIVGRLRDPETRSFDVGSSGVAHEITDDSLLDDAADALEVLCKENDRLRALCDDLYSDILAAASLAPKDSGAYSLLHETIRLRRDRWAKTPNA